jgi:glycosyltransferase involved in cell wall biosynthesis
VIGDTGSTDGTQDLIRSFFASRGIPGELHEFACLNFAQARNEALARARGSGLEFDHLLLCDADMELVVTNPDFSETLSADLHLCRQSASGLTYWNVRLARRSCSGLYLGVTHEFIGGDGLTRSNLEGIHFIDHATGSSRPSKHARDTLLLREALLSEADPAMRARYVFYLANTLREAGELDEALSLYLQRSKMGHWQEEAFMSLLHAGRLRIMLGHPPDQVLSTLADASARAPWRAEALHESAVYCRQRNDHHKAYDFARRGLDIPYPQNSLFVLDWIYRYGLLDEFAISAYWAGRPEESLKACEQLLQEGLIPQQARARIETNAGYARDLVKKTEATPADQAQAQDGAEADADVERRLPALLAAFEARPDQADRLLALASHFRKRGLHNTALLFSERGLALPVARSQPPYGEDVTSDHLRQEFSICAFYSADAKTRERGFDTCNALALGRRVPKSVRDLARYNISYYAGPAADLFPSLRIARPAFTAPEGYHPLNPSVAVIDGTLMLLIRCVNYLLEQERYVISGGGHIIRTRNYLLTLDDALAPSTCRQVLAPKDWPAPAYMLVQGFEDIRLIYQGGRLSASATVRELNPESFCEIVLAAIEPETPQTCRLTAWRTLSKVESRRHEKNWTPVLDGGELRFIYTYDPAVLVDRDGHETATRTPEFAADHFRGGSQAIPFDNGYLSVIHETVVIENKRTYLHRFVQTDRDGVLISCSRPFYFRAKGIEFAAGLARRPQGNGLLVSFGFEDKEAWLAEFDEEDVRRTLRPALP